MLAALQNIQLRSGQRGGKPRFGILLGQKILEGRLVVGCRNHRLGQKHGIARQHPATNVEVCDKKPPLPLQFRVVLVVLVDLYPEEFPLHADVVYGKIVPVIEALAQEFGPCGLKVAQHVIVVQPRFTDQLIERYGAGCPQIALHGGHVAIVGRRGEQRDQLPLGHVRAVRDAHGVEQSVVADRKIRRRIERGDGYGRLHDSRILDDVTPQDDQGENHGQDRYAPTHDPRRRLAQNRLGLLAVKVFSLRHGKRLKFTVVAFPASDVEASVGIFIICGMTPVKAVEGRCLAEIIQISGKSPEGVFRPSGFESVNFRNIGVFSDACVTISCFQKRSSVRNRIVPHTVFVPEFTDAGGQFPSSNWFFTSS